MSITLYPWITGQEGMIIDQTDPTPNTNTQNDAQVYIEETDEITLLSEESLLKIWNTPEEDEAWKDL